MPASPSLPKPLAWALLLLSAVFFVLSGLFILAPRPGALFFGLDTRDASALFYVRAVGLRDLALATYLLGLTLAGQRRALSILLAATTMIPAGDIALLTAAGAGTPIHYLLHLASLLCFAGLAIWSRSNKALD